MYMCTPEIINKADQLLRLIRLFKRIGGCLKCFILVICEIHNKYLCYKISLVTLKS